MSLSVAAQPVAPQFGEHVRVIWQTDEPGLWDVEIPTPDIPSLAVSAALNDLIEALGDLDEVVTEAAGEGYPRPSGDAISSAGRLLRQMYEIAPRRIEVYPTADGEVTLDVSNDRGSVILLCDSRGGALCLVNVNGDRRRARYSSTMRLPDGFVREALTELVSPVDILH